ncbi:hypothetical protein ACSBR1_039992 [Camellia fascicularis]
MFTSRLKGVAMHASPDCHPHCLRPLTEEESWELLQRKVFQNKSCPPQLIEIGKQIMKRCEGLPLAIVVIAGLLAKNIKTQESWKKVVQSVSSYIVSDPNQYLDTLALSYNHLPRHLKPCFLYLGAFPEDQEISVQRLIWLWITEGFIQKIEQKSLEEVAEGYLMDLIQRSLWEEISGLGMLLPNLELLKLQNDAGWGCQWTTIDDGFPRLKFLKLKNLNVKRWITCSSHFPSLQHLSLERCQYLEEIPSSFGDILTLQLIEVTYCHLTVVESVRKIKEEQDSIGNNWLKVLIRK